MAKVALDGTINMQGTKKIDWTNLAQLREPAKTSRPIAAGLWGVHYLTDLKIATRREQGAEEARRRSAV